MFSWVMRLVVGWWVSLWSWELFGLIRPAQLALGMLIYALGAWRVRTKRNRRKRQSVVTKVMTDLNADALETLTKREVLENLPSWFSFPEYERVTWLNTIMASLWPEIDAAVSAEVVRQVNPILAQECPKALRSIELEADFTLGTQAPKIAGIAVNLKETRLGKELVLDIDFKWASDADIGVIVKTKPVGTIRASLHDFQVFARARLILTYFVKELPVVGAVIASLLESPEIDFDLRVQGSNITDAVGLENIIQLVIAKIVDDMLLWPARVVTPLIPGIDPENLQPKVLGVLYVNVVAVKEILSTDVVGDADPYVQLGVNRARMAKTSKKFNCSEAEYNETFQFRVTDIDHQHLYIFVNDHDRLGSDEVIGTLDIPMSRIAAEEHIGDMQDFDEYIKLPNNDDRYFDNTLDIGENVFNKFSQCTGLKSKDIPRPEGTSGRIVLQTIYIPFNVPDDFRLGRDCFPLPPPGILLVKIIDAHELHSTAQGYHGKNLYIRCTVGSMVRETAAQIAAVNNCSTYNEELAFVGIDIEQDQELRMQLIRVPPKKDLLLFKKEQVKGEIKLPIQAVAESGFLNESLQLNGMKSGYVKVSMQFFTNEQVNKYRRFQRAQTLRGATLDARASTASLNVPQ